MMTIAAPPSRIRRLDADTINRIAAGEVVERPASALKELIENALDAGASRVWVDLADGGKAMVRVRDDGSGMSPDELPLALERHATSKIRTESDLRRICSYGFRGEALPAIASVSRFRIESGVEVGLRHAFRADGGEFGEPERCAGPRGTTVEVGQIFYNVPARLGFLKSDSSEYARCLEVAQRAALAAPGVAFVVRHNGREALNSPGTGDPTDALAAVWGVELARSLVPVDRYDGAVRVTGFAAGPCDTRPSRSHQWLAVNDRPVRSRLLWSAVDAAYRKLTPERRYPPVALSVALAGHLVDVNVSPSKSEVRFRDERAVFDAVRHAVADAIMDSGGVPDAAAILAVNSALGRDAPAGFAGAGVQAPFLGFGGVAESAVAVPGAGARAGAAQMLDGLRIIGQMDRRLIVAENDHGLLLVDQHEAHERVLLERFLRSRSGEPIPTQALLTPCPIALERREAAVVCERLEELAGAGFELEPFGDCAFLLRAAPAMLRGSPEAAARELARELTDTGRLPGRDARETVLTLAACKAAIKRGESLGEPEMRRLIEQLAFCESPYLCPHGVPTMMLLAKSALDRRFGTI